MWIRGNPDPNPPPIISHQTFCVKIEEEELLRAELRKIEARKKEREKKTADLQKLIAQADSSAAEVSDLCFPSFCSLFLLSVSSAAEVSDLCFPLSAHCFCLLFRCSDPVGSAYPDPKSLLFVAQRAPES
jgi:hypothetical protein